MVFVEIEEVNYNIRQQCLYNAGLCGNGRFDRSPTLTILQSEGYLFIQLGVAFH